MGYKVAVIGATGNVGREILKIMAERNFPADQVAALASSRSVGQEVSYGDDKILKIQDLEKFDFTGWDIALSSPGGAVSAKHSPRAAAAGCVVIDNTSHFRMFDDVPLVVPEVNPEAIADYKKSGIIANPNCSTIQMMVALKPLHQLGKIKRVVVSTYQSVAGAGKEGMDELYDQSKGVFVGDAREPKKFAKPIAFNLIPQIDVFMEDGSTKEEWKMVVETAKILDPSIKVNATCVRVPVFVGHSESINVEFENPVSVADAKRAWASAPGIQLLDRHEPGGYITPIEVVGEDDTFISRVRKDPTVENGLSFWCVSDNLRKGAALNAVQIAEVLIRDYLKK